jgi:hypothetical protein
VFVTSGLRDEPFQYKYIGRLGLILSNQYKAKGMAGPLPPLFSQWADYLQLTVPLFFLYVSVIAFRVF